MKLTALGSTCIAMAAMLAFEGAYAQPGNGDLDLVCTGTGEKVQSQTDYSWDKKSHEYKDNTTVGKGQVSGTVQVQIHDGQGRMRVPKSLLPPLVTGSDDGWFAIRNLSVRPDRIDGSIKLNGLNKPNISIDRRSGTLRIDGMESFDGTCSAYNAGATKF
ncbi:hypothetical protein [Dyella ginsengisoli]|uniref:hypothetical protein n=1 Tax=Dyella ginsengisoli TaxID=363848 RepID=UPI00034A5736|nr:hypothetical protein [Dyella ginsengisoli]